MLGEYIFCPNLICQSETVSICLQEATPAKRAPETSSYILLWGVSNGKCHKEAIPVAMEEIAD